MKRLWSRGLFFLLLGPSLLLAKENPVVVANNRWAFDFYAQFKKRGGNVFYSPYSVSSAFAMLYEGAKGPTAQEIQSVFHFPQDDSLRRSSFLDINAKINGKHDRYKFVVTNALWAEKTYGFLPNYFSTVENYYGGKATPLDFQKQPGPSCLTINRWVEEKTENKIKNLIDRLDDTTRLVITNAIYFKGSWKNAFDKDLTKNDDFRVTPAQKIKTPMMALPSKTETRLNYGETDAIQVLELPYAGDDLSMLILLPKNDNLKRLEDSLNSENLTHWKGLLTQQEVVVHLPKFKFEKKYFMENDLRLMGMPSAFVNGLADFSGMTGNKELSVDKVIHQAFVDVHEEGTEAAAATAIIMTKSAFLLPSTPKLFRADHPFVFIIQDKKTGCIFFIGRVADPSQ